MAFPLTNARLYGILDLGYVPPQDAEETAASMLDGGVDILQLRAKGYPAADVLPLAAALTSRCAGAGGVPLIINDHPGVAADAGAAGVHVGQDDTPVERARGLAGGGATIVGKSTHSLSQAEAAAAEGADYIGFGPLFSTPTKPGRAAVGLGDIDEVHRRLPAGFPVFCIGGIKRENLEDVIAAGARRVVIVSGILLAADIRLYIQQVRSILDSCQKSNLPTKFEPQSE